MVVRTKSETLRYLLVITSRGASEVLISQAPSFWSLPSCEALREERLAPQFVAAARERWNIPTYCMWSDVFPHKPESENPLPYATLETLGADGEPPLGMSWARLREAVGDPALEPSHQMLLRRVAEEFDSATDEDRPFSKPGWIYDLLAWVEPEIRPRRLTGKFDQLNASSTFSLIRIETTGAAVWFKATGEPNAHERPITCTLARLFPDFLARLIAEHPPWNGWLSQELEGPTLDNATDVAPWSSAVTRLAELQILSCERESELLKAGLKELTISSLAREITPFLARMSELMALQQTEPPEILRGSEIADLADCLQSSLGELAEYAWPNTLGHLDPNPRNILTCHTGAKFLDWAEAYVGHPLFTFEYVAEHARRSLPGSEETTQELRDAYALAWRPFISRESLERSLALSPLLAVIACAVADNRWRSAEALENPSLAGYFRSLTRRAHRERASLRTRSHLCRTP